MSKWFKIEKSSWGFAGAIVMFDKIAFYGGQTDHWGLAIQINFYDRSFTIEILNWYLGVEVLHSLPKDGTDN